MLNQNPRKVFKLKFQFQLGVRMFSTRKPETRFPWSQKLTYFGGRGGQCNYKGSSRVPTCTVGVLHGSSIVADNIRIWGPGLPGILLGSIPAGEDHQLSFCAKPIKRVLGIMLV